MQTVITRKAAQAAGLPHFYTGRACCNGHDAPRFVSNGGCVACNKERMATFNSGTRRGRTAKLQGLFTYELHTDDHAKALAFCQALDMDRGRTPKVPAVKEVLAPRTVQQIEDDRARIFSGLRQPEKEVYVPKL